MVRRTVQFEGASAMRPRRSKFTKKASFISVYRKKNMKGYENPVCRGSWELDTACGTCERCMETKTGIGPLMPQVKPAKPDNSDLIERLVVEYTKHLLTFKSAGDLKWIPARAAMLAKETVYEIAKQLEGDRNE